MDYLENIESLAYFSPEILLVVFAAAVIILDLVVKNRESEKVAYLALVGLGCSLVAIIITHSALGTNESKNLFWGMIRLDGFAVFFKVLLLLATAATILFSIRSEELDVRLKGEYYALLLAVTFGMFLMASATNLLMIFIALETVSLTSYILAGFLTHSPRSSEAAFKYITYGAVASGTMLFGLSLIFGMAGTGDLTTIGQQLPAVLASGEVTALGVLIAITFILAGIGYKIASVPFHMWSPDVYEGAPIPITAFLSVASKAAGFALFLRFFFSGFGNSEVMQSIDLGLLLAIISALTMTIGNLAALPQQNVKRLLAYSSIAHGGYLLMGAVLLTNGDAAIVNKGIGAILFYLVIYFFMNLGAFYVVVLIANEAGTEMVEGYRGLSSRAPLVAGAMAVFLFALTGIPPLAGFFGKWVLFTAVIEGNLYWLAFVGLLNSVVSLYYYARIVKAMYLESAEDTDSFSFSKGTFALLTVFVVPTLLIGLLNIFYSLSEKITLQ
ncbi:MAG: NADH-quinone oxidoreductase subunit N [Candidatus Poribacteria bacterium]|nr:NADH-quinone oxidoreductase subunit N [Candidatus Poribacteria bacterium]